MRLEVAGQQYTGFASAKLELRLDQACSRFTFDAQDDQGRGLPFVQGQSCRVFVDGELASSGFIESIGVSGDDKTHNLQISGRSRVCDLVDGEIASLEDFPAPISLARIIELTIDHLEIPDLRVVDLAKPALFNKAEDIAAPEPGDSAFTFIETLCRKRQTLFSDDPDGNVLLLAGKGERIDARLVNERGNDQNNVLRYAVNYTGAERWFKYLAMSQGNPSVGSLLSDDTSAVHTFGIALDEGARPGRQRVIGGESSMSDGQAKTRAAWQLKSDRVKSRTLSYTLSGYRDQQGELWRYNTAPTVLDAFCAVDGRMLINNVTFTMTAAGKGRTTVLALLEEDAYTTSLEQPEQTKKKQGAGLAWDAALKRKQAELAQEEAASAAARDVGE